MLPVMTAAGAPLAWPPGLLAAEDRARFIDGLRKAGLN